MTKAFMNAAALLLVMPLDVDSEAQQPAVTLAVRSDPKLPDIHLALALIWLELKRLDHALAEIELELKLVPESKSAVNVKKRIEATQTASTP